MTERWAVWCEHDDGRRYWLGDASQSHWTQEMAERIARYMNSATAPHEVGHYTAKLLPLSAIERLPSTEKFGPPLTEEEERLWRMDADGATEDQSHAYLIGRVFATVDARERAVKDAVADVLPAERLEELKRLRELARSGLLSMTQVDWLFTVIDDLRTEIEGVRCHESLLLRERDTAEARVKRLEHVIEDANNVLYDSRAHDIEHSISCHADTLPKEFRRVATGADEALEILQVVIQERFK